MKNRTPAEQQLIAAQEDVVRESREQVALDDGNPVTITGSLTIIEYESWDDEGEEVSGLTIVPNGSSTLMLGLIDRAATRFRAEEIEDLLGR